MTQISFDGRVAIITGSGRGLGRAYAYELVRRGAAVVVNDLPGDGPSAAKLVTEEINAGGGRAIAVDESVGSESGGQRLVDAALEAFGTVDIVISNAGPLQFAPFGELPADFIDLVIDVHVKGALWVTQPAWRVMSEKQYGRIVLTSSNAGAFGLSSSEHCAAAKSAALGLGRALALDGETRGIKVNAILPFAVDTPRLGSAARVGEDAEAVSGAIRELIDRSEPRWTASLVALLASERCPVSGEAFSSVAGRYARVFLGVAEGWLSDGDEPPEAEEILANFGQVESRVDYEVPTRALEEMDSVIRRRRTAG